MRHSVPTCVESVMTKSWLDPSGDDYFQPRHNAVVTCEIKLFESPKLFQNYFSDIEHVRWNIVVISETFAMVPVNQSSQAPHMTNTIIVYNIVSRLKPFKMLKTRLSCNKLLK